MQTGMLARAGSFVDKVTVPFTAPAAVGSTETLMTVEVPGATVTGTGEVTVIVPFVTPVTDAALMMSGDVFGAFDTVNDAVLVPVPAAATAGAFAQFGETPDGATLAVGGATQAVLGG